MRFNFKVKHKIYAGFGVIIGLLIASSIISSGHFESISYSTDQVNEVAVPVLKQSNQLQIDLLKLAKLAALSFNDTTIEQVDKDIADFQRFTTQFNQDYQALYQLVNSGALSPSELEKAKEAFNNYTQAIDSMQQAVRNRIVATNQLSAVHDELKMALDAGGSFLLDLQDLTEGDQSTRETLAGTANQLDGYVFKFFTTSDRIRNMNEIDKVKNEQQDIEFAISDMNAQFKYLKSLTVQVEDNGYMDSFLVEWEKIKHLIQGDNQFIQSKLTQLTEITIAQEQLAIAGVLVNQASDHLDNLLKQTDQQFNQLQSQVLTDVSYSSDQQLIVVVILTIIAVGMGFWVTQSMLVPLRQINKVLGYMAQGDLSRKLAVVREDEFGELSSNINDVVKDLTNLVQQIVQSSTKLTSNLSTVVENSTKEILEMSDYVELQRAKVDEVNHITESMNDSTDQVASQASIAVDQMVQAQSTSQRIDSIAQANNQRIGELALKLDDTTVNINQLQNESAKIGGIVEAITSIAEQTNLLALNAAIEAARAGEQGRGFAVVADEVRSLAVRTQQSTTEIQNMIEKLQKQIEQAVNDIGAGKTQVTECVRYTDELTQSLATIAQAITQIHAMNAQIADSAQTQQEQSNQIKLKVGDVMEIAEKNAEKSRNTLEHSNQIAALAGELDNSVHEFKV